MSGQSPFGGSADRVLATSTIPALLAELESRGLVVVSYTADDLACYVENHPDQRLGEIEWAEIAQFLQTEFTRLAGEKIPDKLHQAAFNAMDRAIENNGFNGRLKAWIEMKLKELN